MRMHIGFRIVLNAFALLTAADIAVADVRAKPMFTGDELAVIERNVLLKRVVQTDPEAVRALLDVMKSDAAETSNSEPDEAPSDNPDIDRLQRSSPQAAHDLIQIMKQAGGSNDTLRALDR